MLIDIENLMYFDVEWEHVFLKIRLHDDVLTGRSASHIVRNRSCQRARTVPHLPYAPARSRATTPAGMVTIVLGKRLHELKLGRKSRESYPPGMLE